MRQDMFHCNLVLFCQKPDQDTSVAVCQFRADMAQTPLIPRAQTYSEVVGLAKHLLHASQTSKQASVCKEMPAHPMLKQLRQQIMERQSRSALAVVENLSRRPAWLR